MPGHFRASRDRMRRFAEEVLSAFAPTFQARALAEAAQSSDDASGLWQPDHRHRYCHRCGATAGVGAATRAGCAHCLDTTLAWRSIIRLASFSPPVAPWIHAMKYHGQWTWSGWFARHLGEAMLDRQWPEPIVFCPVPMHWLRRWRRGYNQSALLAESLAQETGHSYAELLYRTRRTPAQTLVQPASRTANVRGSVAGRPIDLAGWHVVLVDDVKTTGATLTACAQALRKMNAESIRVACIAVADPKNADFTSL